MAPTALTIRSADGRAFSVTVETAHPVRMIAGVIAANLSIPEAQQRLTLRRGGSKFVLSGERSFDAYNITATSDLVVETVPSVAPSVPASAGAPPSPQPAPQPSAPVAQPMQRPPTFPNVNAPATPQSAHRGGTTTATGTAVVPEYVIDDADLPPIVDPYDPRVQQRLLEEIQRQNVAANLEAAVEHTPEAFARVTMLYVPCECNRCPLVAFIDSGAQMTIMGKSTAERCNLLRLMDTRMQGVARGVGSCRILGRIHMAMVNIGGIAIPMSISVLEDDSMDFIVGLDQLRRHQMCIDLKTNALRLHEVSVPFLAEHQLPDSIRGSTFTAAGGSNGGDPESPTSANADADLAKALRESELEAQRAQQPPASTSSASSTTRAVVPSTQQASSGPTSQQKAAYIEAVVETTGLSREMASELLEACDWNVDGVIESVLENASASA